MKRVLALLWVMLLLVACAGRTKPQSTLSPTHTSVPPTRALAPTHTPDPTYTPVPPTRTLAPTHTPYPTPKPTKTPLPEPTATTSPPQPQAGATRVLEPAGITLVYVPAGEFTMGSLDLPIDRYYLGEPHRVVLDSYWIGLTEVTNDQYRRFIEADGYARPEYWTPEGWKWKERSGATQPRDFANDLAGRGPQYPVQMQNWYEADAFARWAGGSLPTEAQWEYACRGQQGLTYPWGNAFECWRGNFDDETERDANCVAGGAGCDGYPGPAPVGSFPAGASWCGALDMSGNFQEWVWDWFDRDYYQVSPSRNPQGPESGDARVLRGGSHDYYSPAGLSCARRQPADPSREKGGDFGFRIVIAAP